MPTPRQPILNRRQLLAGFGGLTAAALVDPRALLASAMPSPLAGARAANVASEDPRHLAWVWQFRHDGDPGRIRDTLAEHGLGIVLKTHDGANWMGRYDSTCDAVTGAASVEKFAQYFEAGGVPFHAWAVAKGNDPIREAQIASEVMFAGARSLFLDLEAHQGFWVGSKTDAVRYGELLRRLQPNARLSISIDPRPWEIDRIPLTEFAAFSDEISPQVYWDAFSTAPNVRKYLASGVNVGTAGVTSRFVLSTAMQQLRAFGLPVHPIGDGTVANGSGWADFIDESFGGADADAVSVWRYGVADAAIWKLLRDHPPRLALSTYTVVPGDTLGRIAAQTGTSVPALVALNGIADPNAIMVGMRLRLRGGTGASAAVSAPAASRTHVVQPGESLGRIAANYGVSTSAIAQANGIVNVNLIRIGQRLLIP